MRLIDCFSGLFVYVAYSLSKIEQKPLAFDRFKKDIDHLLDQSEKKCKGLSFSDEDYDRAKFAVCAWVDEAILCSAWPEKDNWENIQLQRIYYNTTDAGEEFFDRLYLLTTEESGVLEVYCACLVMGFRGRYFAVRDLPDLESINDNIIEKVMENISNPFSSEELKFFPGSYIDDSDKSRRKRQWGLLPFFMAISVIAVGAVSSAFFFLDKILNGMVETYFKSGI